MNKTALITGATSGFGEACSRLLAKNGWRLIITGRRRDRLHQLAHELSGLSEILPLCFDVRDQDAVASNLGNLQPQFGEIDALVNNAGLALGLEAAPEASLSDWDIMVDTNIKGLLYCTRTILPIMKRRNRGHIVNMGSVAGNWPYPGGNVYGATKSFVKQFSLNLRADLLGTAIRVTNLEPGMAETEFAVVRFKGDEHKAKGVYEGMKPLSGEDIAEIVLWVLSLPPHVNINTMEVMPVSQSWAFFAVDRELPPR